MQAPPTVQHVTAPPPPRAQGVSRYNMKLCFSLGLTQLLLGAICLILEIVFLSLPRFYLHSSYQGIWAGIVMIVAGALGVAGGRTEGEPRGLYMATGIISIFASIFSFIAMCVAFSVAWASFYIWNSSVVSTMVALGNIQAILFLAEFVISIVHSVVCFRPICCNPMPITTTTIITTAPGQPVTYVNTGMYPTYPVQHVQQVHTVQQVQPVQQMQQQPYQPVQQGYYGQPGAIAPSQAMATSPVAPPPYSAQPMPNQKV